MKQKMFYLFLPMLVSLFHLYSSASASDQECDNFICLYTLLENGLKTSENFSMFSNTFLLNERGDPQFVYINVNVTWWSCDSKDYSLMSEYVWGVSPVEAVYGPVQEVLHSAFLFDPLIVGMSLIVEEFIPKLEMREDILPSWLIIGQVDVPIVVNSSVCLAFNNSRSAESKVKHILHTFLKNVSVITCIWLAVQ